jgi:acyl carrier protein
MNVEQSVINVIAKEARKDPSQVELHSKIRDLGLDSLSTVTIIIALEIELGIKIPDDNAGDIHTVQDAIELCNRLLS